MLENAINACFSDIDDLKDEDISFTNMKGDDYIKLYKNISEKFQSITRYTSTRQKNIS